MTAQDLIDLRRKLCLTQTLMAKQMELSLRSYQEIETGDREVRTRQAIAAEYVSLSVAVERNEPMLATPAMRTKASALHRLIYEAAAIGEVAGKASVVARGKRPSLAISASVQQPTSVPSSIARPSVM